MTDPSPSVPDSPIGHTLVPRWMPDPRYAPRLLLRSAVTWGALRLALYVSLALSLPPRRGDSPLKPLVLLPEAALAVVVAVVIAIGVDSRLKREPVFYANLCMSPAWRLGIAFGVAGTAEVCMAVYLRHALG